MSIVATTATLPPNMTLFVASVTEMPAEMIEPGPTPIDYVPYADTIADIALREKASAGLVASSTILLSVVVVLAFGLNVMLLATILTSYKLRNCLLYRLFFLTAALNVIDAVLIMFISLLYIANGHWFLSEMFCRLNVWAQQFVFLMSLLAILLMAMERALGLLERQLIPPGYFTVMVGIGLAATNCLAFPTFSRVYPVRVFRFRYLCGVGSRSPVPLTIAHIFVYVAGLLGLLVCFGSLLRNDRRVRHDNRHLPVKPQDFGAFIMESRALQDHLTLAKLVLFMALVYILVEGPYICLCLYVQIRNNAKMIERYGEVEMPQEVDTLLSWLRLFHSLIQPLMILGTCNDLWTKFKDLLFCRRDLTKTISAWQKYPNGTVYPSVDNVLTLVATADGLQLRVPANFYDNLQPSGSSRLDSTESSGDNQIQDVDRPHSSRPYSKRQSSRHRGKSQHTPRVRRRRRLAKSHSPGTRQTNLMREQRGTSGANTQQCDNCEHRKGHMKADKTSDDSSLESSGFYSQAANDEDSTTEMGKHLPPRWRHDGFSAKMFPKKAIASDRRERLGDGGEEMTPQSSGTQISPAYRSNIPVRDAKKAIRRPTKRERLQ